MTEIERIKKICCQETGLSYDKLTKTRKQPGPETKQLICYFLTNRLNMSRRRVGDELNLDHSTITYNLNVCFNTKIILSIEKKINDPLYDPTVLKVIKEVPIKLYGRNLKEIEAEINSLIKKMETARYEDCIEMLKRLDILSIRRKNIVDPLKKQYGCVRDSLKKVNEIKSIF